MAFGRKIAHFRDRKKMNQAEVARRLGVQGPLVSKWENDHAVPDSMQLREMAIMFGVTADQLLDLPSLYGQLFDDLKGIIRKYEQGEVAHGLDEKGRVLTEMVDHAVAARDSEVPGGKTSNSDGKGKK